MSPTITPPGGSCCGSLGVLTREKLGVICQVSLTSHMLTLSTGGHKECGRHLLYRELQKAALWQELCGEGLRATHCAACHTCNESKQLSIKAVCFL